MQTKPNKPSSLSDARARREAALATLAELEVEKALEERAGRAQKDTTSEPKLTAYTMNSSWAVPPAKPAPCPLGEAWIDEIFTWPAATPADVVAYERIREAAKHLVRTITANTPTCADQNAAIRKVREAVMTANAARALKGLV